MSAAVLLGLAALLQAAAPDIELPLPTGPHAIGVVGRRWLDSARVDSLDERRGFREVLARVWYPAATDARAPRAPYAPLVERIDDTAYVAMHTRVRTHSLAGPAILAGTQRFPVIVLAPGRSAGVYDYTTIAEELASQGWIVVGVSSPHHSRIIRADGTLQPVLFPSVSRGSYPSGIDAEQEPMNRLVSADLRFALARLRILDASDSTLRGRLDLGAVGMMGHSNGAMAGSRACALEAICRAFLGIEGQQTREIRLAGTDKPFAQLYGEQTMSFDTLGVFTEIRLHARAPYTLVEVAGAGHNSFTDLVLVRPSTFSYRLDARRGLALTRLVVRAFFERNLLGRTALDAEVAAQKELEVRRFPSPSR